MPPTTTADKLLDAYALAAIRSTPFPNAVVEKALSLPETQCRLLLLVVRQTLGYSAGPGLRRASTRLSHAQIAARIGRSSTAITDAIDGLVREGIIETLDAGGRLLRTPAERRLSRAPLRFRVARRLVEVAVENEGAAVGRA